MYHGVWHIFAYRSQDTALGIQEDIYPAQKKFCLQIVEYCGSISASRRKAHDCEGEGMIIR